MSYFIFILEEWKLQYSGIGWTVIVDVHINMLWAWETDKQGILLSWLTHALFYLWSLSS